MTLLYYSESNAKTAKVRTVATVFEGELLLNRAAMIARDQGQHATFSHEGRRLEISRGSRPVSTLNLRYE